MHKYQHESDSQNMPDWLVMKPIGTLTLF